MILKLKNRHSNLVIVLKNEVMKGFHFNTFQRTANRSKVSVIAL